MKFEKVELWFNCERYLYNSDAKALRGFFGNLYRNRPEFHHHLGDRLIYRHPLIQYKIIGGAALIVGLKEGAYLLKAVPELQSLQLRSKNCVVLKRHLHTDIVPFGLTSEKIIYRFLTPWIPLNEKNYQRYLRIKHDEHLINDLLRRILIGNILSMSKSLRYIVGGKIDVFSCLKECGRVSIKHGTEMAAFDGEFETNFIIPDCWGIGKSSSRGYGSVIKKQL